MIEFPDYCICGLRKKDYVVQNTQYITSLAFEPDYHTSQIREDSGCETSINWEDDDSIIIFPLKNRQQSSFGVARLPRNALDEVNILPSIQNVHPKAVF